MCVCVCFCHKCWSQYCITSAARGTCNERMFRHCREVVFLSPDVRLLRMAPKFTACCIRSSMYVMWSFDGVCGIARACASDDDMYHRYASGQRFNVCAYLSVCTGRTKWDDIMHTCSHRICIIITLLTSCVRAPWACACVYNVKSAEMISKRTHFTWTFTHGIVRCFHFIRHTVCIYFSFKMQANDDSNHE